ncbi:Sigma-70 region 2 [Variovorax sp. CF079]|nr:Sigma-70 region 2 [Variovorax sp. CF079]
MEQLYYAKEASLLHLTTSGGPMAKGEAETVLHDLFVRGLDADAQAYHAFLQKLSAHLRAFLGRRLFGWPDEVEGLVQECLLAMHNQRHTYQSDQPLTAWVHAIARYKMIDLLRSKASREARWPVARGPRSMRCIARNWPRRSWQSGMWPA